MRRAVLVTLGLIVASPAARADDAEGKVIVGTDLSSNTLMVAGLIGEYETVGIVGVTAYAIGGPVVHARYGHWDRAGESLALRLAAPAGLGYLGCVAFGDLHGGPVSKFSGKGPDLGCMLAGFGGIVLGMIGAEILDWTVLTDGDAPAPAARMLTIGGSF